MSTRLANPFQFLDVDRKDPVKKNMETRTEAFVEIYDPYTQVQAAEQSHRCLECGNPYCCLLYTSPTPRDRSLSRMPSSA